MQRLLVLCQVKRDRWKQSLFVELGASRFLGKFTRLLFTFGIIEINNFHTVGANTQISK